MKQNRPVFRDYIRKMLEILDVLQEVEIVHADLKPDNILVEHDGESITDFKIIDFGSAFNYS